MKTLVLALLAASAMACGDPQPVVAPIAPAQLEVPESCYVFEGNVCMTVTSVSVACTGVSPEMRCMASVQLTIPTLVTRGLVSVGVRINGNDYLVTTIDDVANAAPGALVARAPLQRVGGACVTGVSSHIVAVYDGAYPTQDRNGGRPLFVEPVSTNMTCTP